MSRFKQYTCDVIYYVTCRGLDYLSALHSGSSLRSSRPQRAQWASKYTDMRNVFTMVYLTVGYLSVLQYIQCETTLVCLTVGGRQTPEASITHSCVTVRSEANTSRG